MGENKGGRPNNFEATSSKIAFSWVMAADAIGRKTRGPW